MPRVCLALAALVLFTAAPAVAQRPSQSDQSEDVPILRDLQVRHNLLTSTELPQPAFVQLTWPEDDTLAAVVGLGIRAGVGPARRFDTGVFVEYLRNTATSAPQNTFRAGLDMNWQLVPLGGFPGGRRHSPLLLGQLNYKRDGVAEASSLQAALNYTHLFQGNPRVPLPNTYYTLGRLLDVAYAPYVGIEYESVFTDDAPTEGRTVRGMARLDASVYPNVCALWREDATGICQVLEGTLQLAFRRDFAAPTDQGDRNHPYFEAGANLYLLQSGDGKRRAGVGISYISGEDPGKGFQDQQLTHLTLKLLLLP